MATINSAAFAITANLPGNKVKAEVTCKLTFTQFEKLMMANGVKFRLNCQLWGDDGGTILGFNVDDSLYNYPAKFYPDSTPTLSETYVFSATFASGVLNEDSIPLIALEDEVYAMVSLKNLETGASWKKRSNTIVHYF